MATGARRNLTRTQHESESLPAVSPDGTRMAFYTEAPDGLHVLDLETGVRRRLARGGGSARDDSRPPPPSWSPDGRRIAFVRRPGFRSQGVYIVGADGGDPVPLPAARNGHDAFWAAVP